MSAPSSVTVPSARAPGTTSCIRFKQRTKVDLPQPDGPMIAVTWFSASGRSMPLSAWLLPNQALSPFASSLMPGAVAARGGVTRMG